jgi:amidophosphoribosyltransferase
VRDINPKLEGFEASCFDGNYITGAVTPEYLDAIERAPRTGIAGRSRHRERHRAFADEPATVGGVTPAHACDEA